MSVFAPVQLCKSKTSRLRKKAISFDFEVVERRYCTGGLGFEGGEMESTFQDVFYAFFIQGIADDHYQFYYAIFPSTITALKGAWGRCDDFFDGFDDFVGRVEGKCV